MRQADRRDQDQVRRGARDPFHGFWDVDGAIRLMPLQTPWREIDALNQLDPRPEPAHVRMAQAAPGVAFSPRQG